MRLTTRSLCGPVQIRNYFTTIVSLYCGDDNCVFPHDNIAGGNWLIGPDPESNSAGVATAFPAGDLWPHQVKSWQYASGGKLRSDPQLTVTQSFQGNVFISIKLL